MMQEAGNSADADSGTPAHVCHVRRYHSGTDPGKQLFSRRGLSIQVTLFCAGFGTLLFHVLTKLKVPAFLGSSFAFLGGFATVAELDTGIFANMSYGEKLPYACGGVFVAGLLYLVLAMIVKVIGVKRVMRYLLRL